MRLPGCRFLCRHIAPDPTRHVVPATSLARSNALHAAQKPTVPPTHEIFGPGKYRQDMTDDSLKEEILVNVTPREVRAALLENGID